MYPAYSVIFFTSISGAGYSLLVLMNALALVGALSIERWFGVVGFLVALIAITAGLLSSTYHLGRPERAWRAFSQWRSSWLSREGILAVATYVPVGITACGWIFWQKIWWIPAILVIVGALATISATAMIYASLKTVRRWSNRWTLPNYLAMGFTSGSLWLCLLCAFNTNDQRVPIIVAAAAILVAGIIKHGYWRFVNDDIGDIGAGSATGLGRFGKVSLFAAPHTEENYLLKEMGFKVARKHTAKLRKIAFLGAFIIPFVCVTLVFSIPSVSPFLLMVAILANALGTVTERWLFFAEARHVVTLYYGAEAA